MKAQLPGNLEDVKQLLGKLNHAEPAIRTQAWRELRDALDVRGEEGQQSTRDLRGAYLQDKDAWQDVLRSQLADPEATQEAQVGALRLMVRIAGSEEWVWRDTLLATAQNHDAHVDFRGWATYLLRWPNLAVSVDNWSDLGQPLAGLLLNDDQAKVRQWAAYVLGEMGYWGSAGASDGERSRLVDDVVRIRAERALLDRWDKEIDTYVARQLVVSLGQVGGYNEPDAEDGGVRPVAQVLAKAVGYPNYVVRNEVPRAVQRVAERLVSANGKVPEDDVATLRELMRVPVNWLEKPGLSYDQYRAAIRTVAALVPLILKGTVAETPSEPHMNAARAGLEHLLEAAESAQLNAVKGVRSRAVLALQDMAREADEPVRALLNSTAVPRLKAMLADPSERVAEQVADALITIMGDENAADFFADVVLEEEPATVAAAHRSEAWGSEQERNIAILEELARRRAAFAIGRIVKNQQAYERLVESLQKQDGVASRRAGDALREMGGEKAVRALVETRMREFVEDRFFRPIEEANQYGRSILNGTVWMTRITYVVTLIIAGVVVYLGARLFAINVGRIQQTDATQLAATAGAITGVVAALAGLLVPFFWNPAGAIQKANAEMTKVVTAFHGYMGRMRLLGLAFAHEYTEGKPDSAFLQTISNIAGDAMLDSAGLLTDIGYWPGMTVQVPDLKGRTGSEAASEAKARGLEATVKDLVYDEQIEKAKVASQSPAAGTQVRIGRTIELTLSMGKKPTEKTDSDGE